jgi:TolB-like protein/Tfp pilus assembly protein PilF
VNGAEVTAALQRILASEAFAGVERPSRFLRHVVESALQGQSAVLKESLLGVQVFGRDASWDPRADPVVRQEAARLRKRLARYYKTASPEVRIELPVGTYVPVFQRLPGAVPAAEAAIPNNPALPATPIPARRAPRRTWPWFAIALLAVAGLAGGLQVFRSFSAGNASSIVVLPFTSLSADPSKEYFADGLTDEITGQLVRVKSLRVVARTSAIFFKGRHADVRDVGRQLNVTHVLEGSVEWSGEQVRISAHLERASDGSHVWSGTYDRQAKDLLTVQSEVAEAVARALQVSSGMTFASRHVPSEEAHDLFLRATFEMQAQTPDALERAEQDLQRSVDNDPQYAAAWSRLGLVKFNLAPSSVRGRTPAELSEVKSLYRKALSLDPDLGEAHANLGFIAMTTDWDWAGAERELQLASRNGPSVPAEISYGLLLAYRGRFGEADRRLAAALSLDPLSVVTIGYMAAVRYWEGRFPESIAISRQLLDRYPDQLNPRLMLNLARVAAGQAELALADLRPLEAKSPHFRLQEVMALAHLGRREEALRLLRQLETGYERDARVSRQGFALAWSSLGDHSQTVKWLERSADLREFQVLNLAVNPAFADMRSDPAFRALIQRIGL